MKKPTVKQLYAEKQKLEDKAFKLLRKELKKHGGEFNFDAKLGNTWVDEANNDIWKIDMKNVYMEGSMLESYPIEDLGLNDMLYVIGELEHTK